MIISMQVIVFLQKRLRFALSAYNLIITTSMARNVKLSLCSIGRYCFGQHKPSSFYRRDLPERLVALDSPEGKLIFREGLEEGHCESFFTLVQQFITQSDVYTCSSASMAMMLNALKVDPGVNWKGIWRWYDDYNIKHLHPNKIADGLTLQEFDSLSKLNSVRSMAFSPLEGSLATHPATIKKSTQELFRSCMVACTQRCDSLLTVNFHRKTLGQTGIGHYSPIGAYNAKRDMALILDVAKFKYDSYWCPLPYLYEALKPLDSVSKISRGFVINKRKMRLGKEGDEGKEEEERGNEQREEQFLRIQRQQGIVSLVKILLNYQYWHPMLVPVLFEYATSEIHRIDQMVAYICEQLFPNTTNQINEVICNNHLNEEATVLLEAFKRQSLVGVFRLIMLLLSSKQPRQIEGKVKNKEYGTAIAELVNLLQVMQKYLPGKGNKTKPAF